MSTSIQGTPLQLNLIFNDLDWRAGSLRQVPPGGAAKPSSTMLGGAMRSAASNAYDIDAQLPGRGSLGADVGGISIGMQDTLPPGVNGKQLTLSYSLPGIRIKIPPVNTATM
jgi:hypothetical protein